MKATFRCILRFGSLIPILAIFVISLILQAASAGKPEKPGANLSVSPFDLGWYDGYYVNGTNDYIRAVAADGENIYVGGDFSVAGNVVANKIAMWDGTDWHPLGKGLNGPVYTLAVDGHGNLYAGGFFTQAGGKPAQSIARWNGQDWEPLGAGVNGEVSAIALDGILVVGGEFTSAGGVTAHNLAVWDGENWAELGGGVEIELSFNSAVKSIVTDGGDVYVGGLLATAGSVPVGRVTKWNGSTWDNMNGGVYREEWIGSIGSMTLDRDGNLIVGGWFSLAGGKDANQVALWDGTDWSALGSDLSVNGNVAAMIPDRRGGFYVAGPFIAAGGQVVNHVAHWDGNTWSGLDSGVSGGQYGPSARTLALDSRGNLYVGGEFTTAGSTPVNNIAKWVGDHWEAQGSGIDGIVDVLAVDSQDNLYAGGLFETAGGVPVNYIAKWTGTGWEGSFLMHRTIQLCAPWY